MPSKRTIASAFRAAGEIASSVSIFCPIASDWWAFMEAAFMHNSSCCPPGACGNPSRQATESEIAARVRVERAALQHTPSLFQVFLAISDICGELDEVFPIPPRRRKFVCQGYELPAPLS